MYSPMPSEFQFKETPLALGIPKSFRRSVWIFSGIAHSAYPPR